MKKVLTALSSIFVVALFAISLQAVEMDPVEKEYFDQGYADAVQDVKSGNSSACGRRCRAQDPYERGYKVGYRRTWQQLKIERAKRRKEAEKQEQSSYY